jgi:hypothetical protein
VTGWFSAEATITLMPHPFFDTASYPWHRNDARDLHNALSSAIPEPERIEILYRGSGAGLRALPLRGAADIIWRNALESLVAAGKLRTFLGLVLGDPSLAAIHPKVRAVIEAEPDQADRTPADQGTGRASDAGDKPAKSDGRSGSRRRVAKGSPASGSPPPSTELSPLGVLREAIQAVPPVKYALGVAGMGAAAAIIKQFLSTPLEAALGVVGVFFMMVLLFVFASLRRSSEAMYYPSLILIWVTLALFLGTLSLVVTSVFFRKPMPYPELVDQFRPVRYSVLTVKALGSDSRAVAGARVVAQGRNYRSEQTSASDGSATFAGVPSTETDLTLSATAPGFKEGTLHVNPARVQAPPQIVMAAAPPPQVPISDQSKSGSDQKPPVAPPDLIAELRGTWQIVAGGDVSNIRVRRGTFEFTPQRDREVIVGANFSIDGMDAKLTGRATLVRSQLFLKFDITTTGGGAWQGSATFARTAPNTLSGRLQAKNGDDVPVQLQKLTR